jgi:hypothetical protein
MKTLTTTTFRALALTLCLLTSVSAYAQELEPVTIDLGTVSVDGTGYTVNEDSVVTLTQNGGHYIITGSTTTKRIVVVDSATVTLRNADITSSTNSPFGLENGAKVTLILAGTSNLRTSERYSPGLTVPEGAELTIQGDGDLTAIGSRFGAGIGGYFLLNTGTIDIVSGTVFAVGGENSGIGIGAGLGAIGGNIHITGGSVIANGIGISTGGDTTATTISGASTVVLADNIGSGINESGKYDHATVLTGSDVTVYPDSVVLKENFTLPDGSTLIIPAGKTLRIVSGKTFTNNGTLLNYGTVNGTLEGTTGKFVKYGNGTYPAGFSFLTGIEESWVEIDTATYTGEPIDFVVTVTKPEPENEKGTQLDKTTDYQVSFPDDVKNAGTKQIIITGTGNYYGTVAATLVIKKATPTIETLSYKTLDTLEYTPAGRPFPITPQDTVEGLGVITIFYRLPYNDTSTSVPQDTGTYIVMVSIAEGDNYTGIEAFTIDTFTIKTRQTILSVDNIPAQTYTGESIKPDMIIVKDGRFTLIADKDYTVSYGQNIHVGPDSGSVSIWGVGNYTGSEGSATFEISPKSIAGSRVIVNETDTSYIYTGEQIKPEKLIVTDGEITLSAEDYFTDATGYGENIHAGMGSVTVIGQGNYTGTATGTFTIIPKSLANSTVKVNETDTSYIYTGKQIKPAKLIVTDGETTLSPETDYYLTDATAYGENINAGTGSVTVVGQGNYTGTATGTFTIKKATPTRSDLYLYPTNYVYDGQEHSVTVAPGSNVIGMSNDITVKYNGSATPLPRESGMYIVTVDIAEGSNYTGINDLMIGVLTIEAQTVYSISTAVASGGGSLKLNRQSAPKDTEIVVTISRSKGFELDTISAYNANNPAETVNLRLVNDSTRTFTMPAYHVTVVAVFTTNEDEQQIETARELIEQHDYLVPQEEANDSMTVTNWLLNTIEALTGNAVTVDNLSLTGFVAAVAGTQDTPAGTDGSFVFTVRLTKGDSRLVTSARTGSITATPYYHTITLDRTGNGTVLIAPSTDSVPEGTRITLSVSPGNGYKLDSMWVWKAENPNIAVTLSVGADNLYTFIMPSYSVIVSAIFTENTGIEAAGNGLLRAVSTDDGLTVLGLVPGEVFGIYTIQGQLLYRRQAGASEERIALSNKGIYIIVAGERKIKAVY